VADRVEMPLSTAELANCCTEAHRCAAKFSNIGNFAEPVP